MAQTNVAVLNEVSLRGEDGSRLLLQWCVYVHPNDPPEHGYRFIWRRPDGTLQAARGQARLPSLALVERLMGMARTAGWGRQEADDAEAYS